jgi:hypothetical protein
MSLRLKWGVAKVAAIQAQALGLTAPAAARRYGVKPNSIYRAAVRCGFRFPAVHPSPAARHVRLRTI